MSSLDALLNSLIDYAGLFPPADLSMDASVRNFATYRQGPHRSALGRFIVPVARLEEFERVAVPYLSPGEPWPLSVLAGPALDEDLAAVAAFNGRRRDAVVVSIELKAGTMNEILAAAKAVAGLLETFYEIPISNPPGDLLDTIQTVGGRAKIRTGGAATPTSRELARFLQSAAPRVAFKATAGLHHAIPVVRGPEAMHGFLNLFAAAAFVSAGTPDGYLLVDLLEDADARHFSFQGGEFRWKDQVLEEDDLSRVRRDFALSFGSCSFEEPFAELQELGFL